MAIESDSHHTVDFDLGHAQEGDANRGGCRAAEVFDRIEGRPTLKIPGPTGGPIETVTYDLKKLSPEKIKTIRAILAEAVDPAPVP